MSYVVVSRLQLRAVDGVAERIRAALPPVARSRRGAVVTFPVSPSLS
jgi:hypothetical protein